MPKARITIVQSGEFADARANLERMKADIRANLGSDLIVFPELAVHGHDWTLGPPAAYAAMRGLRTDFLEELDAVARECGTSLVYGEVEEQDGKLFNLATFTDGHERTSYAKTHVHWSERFTPGDSYPVVRNFRSPLGMLICYDAAFPEVPRLLALAGAEIIVNVSAIPASFPLRHVHRRLVACSVQNQVFTVFANRSGPGFLGGSAVIDPQGETLAVADQTGTLVVDIDLEDVQRWRAAEPLFPHRRPEIYREISNTKH